MRIALVTASLVLVGGLAGACGGSPDDATTKDFCDAWEGVVEAGEDDFDKAKEAYEEFADTGTPEDMGDDAREGFEIMTDLVADSDNEEEAEEAFDDLSSDEKEKFEKLGEYINEQCEGPSTQPSAATPTEPPSAVTPSEIPTELPSEFPTELPSDFPTELPSEFPSDLLSDLPSEFPSELLEEMPTAPNS